MAKGDETRERITGAAFNLIHEKGYTGTSLNDISDLTGVKKGNLYFHFSSKERLVIESLKDALLHYESEIFSSQNELSPVKRLENILDSVMNFHLFRNRFANGCLFGNLALETGGNGTELSVFLRDVFARWERKYEHLLTQCVEAGELKLRESAALLARMIIASIEGGIMLSKLNSSHEPLEECTHFIKSIINERKVQNK